MKLQGLSIWQFQRHSFEKLYERFKNENGQLNETALVSSFSQEMEKSLLLISTISCDFRNDIKRHQVTTELFAKTMRRLLCEIKKRQVSLLDFDGKTLACARSCIFPRSGVSAFVSELSERARASCHHWMKLQPTNNLSFFGRHSNNVLSSYKTPKVNRKFRRQICLT